MTPEERCNRLDQFIAEGRIIRNRWCATDDQGRELACLLAALAPETIGFESAGYCPSEVMPAWLAYLTPWIDDAPSAAAWPTVIRRYAAVARRWNILTSGQWERVKAAVCAVILVESGEDSEHLLFYLTSVASGLEVTQDEWDACALACARAGKAVSAHIAYSSRDPMSVYDAAYAACVLPSLLRAERSVVIDRIASGILDVLEAATAEKILTE